MSEAAAPARVIQGKYRLETKLGAGAFGTVYRAIQLGLEKPVAIKVLTPEAFKAEGAVERFEREALLASKISHPVMAQVLDFGVDEGAPFLVMELVDGEEVAEILVKYGPLPPLRAISVMRQLASLLSEVHGRGIVHRDLKPANLKLLRYTPTARQVHLKVLDFGIAKDVGSEQAQRLTATGSFVGTPRYMSPEQVRGHAVDARSDLYSCGVIFYELLTGDAPFRAASVAELIAKLLYDTPPVLPERFPSLLQQTVQRLLLKDPSQRFADAHAFDAALEQCEGVCREVSGTDLALDSTMASGRGSAAAPLVAAASAVHGRSQLGAGATQTAPASGAGSGSGPSAGAPAAAAGTSSQLGGDPRVRSGEGRAGGEMANAATVAAAVAPPARRSGLLSALTLIAVAAAAVAVVFSLRGRGAGKQGGGPPGVQGVAADAALLAAAPPSTSPSPSGAGQAPGPTASPPAPTASPTASTSPAPSRSPSTSPRPSPRGPGDKTGNGDVDGDDTPPPVGTTNNAAFDCVASAERVADAVDAGRFKQTANLARRFFESDAVRSGACSTARTSVRYSQCLALCMTGDAAGLSACRRKLGRDAGGNGYLRKLQENCGFQP
ncbi:MAG: serine/threonine protein kinase [Deltaproteobacteria bacterium]|nr:serine/threonine protein kinase [Deltaproteobacteria bacterium]